MDVLVELAKDLGYELQNDDRFVRLQIARGASDEDEGLQSLIGEFNLKRLALNSEMAKEPEEEKDKDKIAVLDGEVREIYDRLMQNENMSAYQIAKGEMDKVVNQIITIITMAAQGHDPDEAVDTGCGGSCSGCSGCH